MPNCTHCNKPLRAVGVRRSNGKAGKPDWNGRTLHTKCWVLLQKYPSLATAAAPAAVVH